MISPAITQPEIVTLPVVTVMSPYTESCSFWLLSWIVLEENKLLSLILTNLDLDLHECINSEFRLLQSQLLSM